VRAIENLRTLAVVTLGGFAADVAERGGSQAAGAGLASVSGLACALAFAVARALRDA
jgi:hypothetical protein